MHWHSSNWIWDTPSWFGGYLPSQLNLPRICKPRMAGSVFNEMTFVAFDHHSAESPDSFLSGLIISGFQSGMRLDYGKYMAFPAHVKIIYVDTLDLLKQTLMVARVNIMGSWNLISAIIALISKELSRSAENHQYIGVDTEWFMNLLPDPNPVSIIQVWLSSVFSCSVVHSVHNLHSWLPDSEARCLRDVL